VRVFCGICQRFMGEVEITGKLRKGYTSLSIYVLCRECHEEPKGVHSGDFTVDSLLNLFGMKGKI
jgi:hypothetical protein